MQFSTSKASTSCADWVVKPAATQRADRPDKGSLSAVERTDIASVIARLRPQACRQACNERSRLSRALACSSARATSVR